MSHFEIPEAWRRFTEKEIGYIRHVQGVMETIDYQLELGDVDKAIELQEELRMAFRQLESVWQLEDTKRMLADLRRSNLEGEKYESGS